LERYYIKSARNLAFEGIRFPTWRKPSVYQQNQPQIILHEILHFSRKSCQTGPKLGVLVLLVPTPFFGLLPIENGLTPPKIRGQTDQF
jgi:hypothetical protein